MKIFILLAHPDKETFNGSIADAYESKALELGHQVKRRNLGEMDFDPILWKGYKVVQELEPDLKQAWENILWCDQWIIIYPVWWGSVPALLKGFLDRTLLPSFAFKYHEKDPLWDKLLKGRSALLVTTADAPKLWLWWQYKNSDLNTMKEAVLKFCGFSPVKTKRITRLRYLTDVQRQREIDKLISAFSRSL